MSTSTALLISCRVGWRHRSNNSRVVRRGVCTRADVDPSRKQTHNRNVIASLPPPVPGHRFRSLSAFVAVVTVLSAGPELSARQSAREAGPVLRTIRLVPSGPPGTTTMILEADGELPEPVSDAIDGPPRVYLDLHGVTPGESIGPPGSDALVRRTRVALNSASPLVTRVVFDLSRRVP